MNRSEVDKCADFAANNNIQRWNGRFGGEFQVRYSGRCAQVHYILISVDTIMGGCHGR
jgi:hypothetical protein